MYISSANEHDMAAMGANICAIPLLILINGLPGTGTKLLLLEYMVKSEFCRIITDTKQPNVWQKK
jgi:hypothetical protein